MTQVWHKLDERSPLYKLRDKLHVHLDGIEVLVSACDMASLQQVRLDHGLAHTRTVILSLPMGRFRNQLSSML